jgi:O-antigen ligase
MEIWKETVKVIKDNPIIGRGVNTFRSRFVKQYAPSLDRWPHVHNLYLQITLEIGILGLIAFLWIFFRFYKYCFQILRQKNMDLVFLGLLSGITAFLIASLFDVFYDERLLCLFWIITGLVIVYPRIFGCDELTSMKRI